MSCLQQIYSNSFNAVTITQKQFIIAVVTAAASTHGYVIVIVYFQCINIFNVVIRYSYIILYCICWCDHRQLNHLGYQMLCDYVSKLNVQSSVQVLLPIAVHHVDKDRIRCVCLRNLSESMPRIATEVNNSNLMLK